MNYIFSVLDYFAEISTLLIFIVKNVAGLFSQKKKEHNRIISGITKKQIYFTAIQALFLVSSVAVLFGAVIVIQSITQLPKWGAEKYIGKILVLVIIRELGPIFTALIVIGRSASAIATEIGNMSVANEIEALESMGIDPLEYILIPRLLGMSISIVLLTFYFNIVGILGGFLAANITADAAFTILFNNLINAITFVDIIVAFFKSLGFGIIISIIAVHQGLNVKLSLIEVPRAATKSVVHSLLFLFIFNGLLTVLFYV
ncbi:MAG: ABC transporter permease [Elusimicrobiota bacterium]